MKFDLPKFNKFHIASVVIIVVVAFLSAGFMYAKKEKFTSPAGGAIPSKAKASSGNTLVWYMAEWCPHCKSMETAWAEAIKQLGSTVASKRIRDTDEEIKTKNVQGFPTIRMERPDGSYIEHNGPRTTEGLLAFAKENATA